MSCKSLIQSFFESIEEQSIYSIPSYKRTNTRESSPTFSSNLLLASPRFDKLQRSTIFCGLSGSVSSIIIEERSHNGGINRECFIEIGSLPNDRIWKYNFRF